VGEPFRIVFSRLSENPEFRRAHVDVQTHGRGACIALQAMAFEHEVWVDNALLTAPAVDNESPNPQRTQVAGFLPALSTTHQRTRSEDRVSVGALDRARLQGPEHRT
jgi:hypothetical protein